MTETNADKLTPILGTVHTYPQKNDLELGKIKRTTTENAFGRTILADTTDTERDIWSFADDSLSTRLNKKVFPAATSNLYLASSDSSDTSLQLDAKILLENGEVQDFTVTTDASDAQSPTLIGTGVDINSVKLSGDNQSNSGNLYLTNNASFTSGVPDDASSVLAHVPVGYGQSLQAFIRVPENKKCILDKIFICLNRDYQVQTTAFIRCNVKREGGSFIVEREWPLSSENNQIQLNNMVYDAGSIIVFSVVNTSSNTMNVAVDCQFDYVDV